jgi:hypothetical protein
MSKVIDAKAVFARIRCERDRAQLTAIKHKQLMDTHRKGLIDDIATVLMVEAQRPTLGDETVDTFLDEFQIYREFSAIIPHTFNDAGLVEAIASGLAQYREQFPSGRAFDRLRTKALDSEIGCKAKDKKYKVLLSQACNTSSGIALFREFCKLDEAQPLIGLVSVTGLQGSSNATAAQVASDFVDTHIMPSRSLISLNTQRALANHHRRSRENAFEASCMRSNLRLVRQ